MRGMTWVGLALIGALAAAGCTSGVDPSLVGDWEVARREGEVNPHPADTVFTFTEEVVVIGVLTAEGGYLHSAFLPYTLDPSQTPQQLDHEGGRGIAAEVGIYRFVDQNTLDWKTAPSDHPRPSDFTPNEQDSTLYQLRRNDSP